MDEIKKLLEHKIGHQGWIISGSKSGYRERYPNHFVIFNAYILTVPDKDSTEIPHFVWFADIDFTSPLPGVFKILKEMAMENNIDLYVFNEGEYGRNGHGVADMRLDNFSIKFEKDGKVTLNESNGKYYYVSPLNFIKEK